MVLSFACVLGTHYITIVWMWRKWKYGIMLGTVGKNEQTLAHETV